MLNDISYSHLFACLDEIISYLKSIRFSDKNIEALQQTQKVLLVLELMNISIHS